MQAEACVIERHAGLSDDDAASVEEVVCAEVRSRMPGAHVTVRAAKLGPKLIVTVRALRDDGSIRAEEHLVLSGVEEVPVAAPRLVDAIAEKKPVASTVDVTNVVDGETRPYKKQPSLVHGWLGILGVSSPGYASSAGAAIGLSGGSERWSFVAELRLSGQAFLEPLADVANVFLSDGSSSRDKIKPKAESAFASLSGGVRWHASSANASPFVGGGLALDYFAFVKPGADDDPSLTGLSGFVELGLDLERTRMFGGTFSLRLDLPAAAMKDTVSTNAGRTTSHETFYAPVVGAMVALRF